MLNFGRQLNIDLKKSFKDERINIDLKCTHILLTRNIVVFFCWVKKLIYVWEKINNNQGNK